MVKILRAIPADRIRLVVLDLDGTLIDSGADLCASVNATLRHFGRPTLPEATIAGYIGNGASVLVRRAMGEPYDPIFHEYALAYFIGYYGEHKLDQTRLYPGALDSLRSLASDAAGVPRNLAVLTNKPVGASKGICEGLGLEPYLFRIYGGNSFATKKPDPEGLNTLMREAGAAAEETLMIGDSDIDIHTAHNAGAWSIACSYGFAPHTLEEAQPDCIVDSAAEWPLVLVAQPASARK